MYTKQMIILWINKWINKTIALMQLKIAFSIKI